MKPNPAHLLLAQSSEFEVRRPVFPGEENPVVTALRALNGLEDVVRESLGTVAATADRTAKATTTATATAFATASARYRPALGDPSVVEALLQFKNPPPFENAPRPAPKPSPKAPPEPVTDEFRAPRVNRLSARDLEPCFPFAPASNLMRPKT
jgi:hypothetical protein